MKLAALSLPLLLLLAATPASTPSRAVQAALADPARPATDSARDAARHPAELLTLMGVKPGDKVADFIMGSGYWTRILAKAVGPTGKVYAYQPAEFISFRAKYGTDQDAAVQPYANVVPSRESLGAVTFPEQLDGIITVQNWHDLHLKISPPTLGALEAKALFAALKPGGVLLVVDHVGLNGGGAFADADPLHRGDAAATRAEIEAAGFRLAATSPLLAAAADPHTANVFTPAIRGKTDQFIMKFIKPR